LLKPRKKQTGKVEIMNKLEHLSESSSALSVRYKHTHKVLRKNSKKYPNIIPQIGLQTTTNHLMD
jgi:hypothetical protein